MQKVIEFQYISCYSLSFCNIHNCYLLHMFQYISCYSLSESNPGYHFDWEFQYISCYSLSSWRACWIRETGVSIHLMLLFIREGSGIITLRGRFNTSHVTLYPRSCPDCDCVFIVSIHLMLLFISLLTSVAGLPERFNTSHVTLYQKIST